MLALQAFRYKLKWIKWEIKEKWLVRNFSFEINFRPCNTITIHIKCYQYDLVLLLKCLTMITRDEILITKIRIDFQFFENFRRFSFYLYALLSQAVLVLPLG